MYDIFNTTHLCHWTNTQKTISVLNSERKTSLLKAGKTKQNKSSMEPILFFGNLRACKFIMISLAKNWQWSSLIDSHLTGFRSSVNLGSQSHITSAISQFTACHLVKTEVPKRDPETSTPRDPSSATLSEGNWYFALTLRQGWCFLGRKLTWQVSNTRKKKGKDGIMSPARTYTMKGKRTLTMQNCQAQTKKIRKE